MKEELCYVSKNFTNELFKSKRKAGSELIMDTFGGNLKKYFALPDYQKIIKGYVKRDNEDIGADDQVGSCMFLLTSVLFSGICLLFLHFFHVLKFCCSILSDL